MTIQLNHTVVPVRDQHQAARFFAGLFGLTVGEDHYFTPVKINDHLTLLFESDSEVVPHHYAFHVSEAEFDAIFARVQKAGLAYGSEPGSMSDGKLNHWGGGRGVYFKDSDGHILELMTVAQ